MNNDLYELTRKRRSIRRYGSEHIDDEIISEIMKVALTAPTSFGNKPVEFVVVRDKDMIRKLDPASRWAAPRSTARMP